MLSCNGLCIFRERALVTDDIAAGLRRRMPCAQIAMTSLRRLHFTFFFKHAIVNISSVFIRRKCSLNISKCVCTNNIIVFVFPFFFII